MSARPAYVGPTLLLTWIQAAVSWAVFAPPVLARQALPELGLEPVWIGLQPAIVFGAALVSTVSIGPLAGRIHAMRLSQALVATAGLGAALIATGRLPWAVLGSALVGVGLGPTTPASSHVLARVTPARMLPAVFSIKQSAVPLGGALAGIVGPAVMVRWGWQSSIGLVAAACFATALAIHPWASRYVEPRRAGATRRIELIGPLRSLWASRVLRWLALGVVPMIVTQYGLTTFLPLFLQEKIGLGVGVAGSVFAAAQLAGGVGRIAFGVISGRWMAPLTMLLVLALVAALAASLTASSGPEWPLGAVYALGVVFGASALGWNGIFLAETARLSPPEQVGRMTGAISVFVFGAMIVGPTSFSVLLGAAGFGAAYLGTATLAAAGAACFRRTRSVDRSSRGPMPSAATPGPCDGTW